MKNRLAAAVLLLVASAGAANAATVMYQASIPLQSTNWSDMLNLPQWDPALFPNQTLTKVTVKLTGTVEGDARIESLDAAPAIVNYNVAAQIGMTGPGGLNIVVLPLAAGVFNAAIFDGVIDFAGTSGLSNLGLSNSAQNSSMLTDPPTDLAAAGFIGAGSLVFNLTATGASNATGPGNVIQQFRTDASANVMITYEFVPAPGAVALLGLGGLMAGRRRR